ncbi:MAG TPA: NAD(P)-dependent oxidoreductase [Mycetocola sp.]|jgi:D-3-phosphoglycerate dehydrogenase|uniref:NAD(P)-dependent oxidoreductase n=1 Tax=Mycetocola sp. TaxID=1871042 RepID=UPI00260E7A20|nr:NAD(P)-dependent oxidoreductase [Mycetocola sp.]HEV7849619.1 NAD(P)-dependent oxidoreductase [Mycetocola sp.]
MELRQVPRLMAHILATSRSFSSGSRDLLGELAAEGHQVTRGSSTHHLDELGPQLAHIDAWIAGTGPITAAHLDAAPRLKVVARYGVGIDAVDRAAAAERGILVTNTPGANSGAVADHAVGLMLAVLRGTTEGDRRVRMGNWSVLRGRELGSLTIGIVGFGRIGQGVARRLSGFGSRIVAHDPWLGDDAIRAADAQPLDVAEMPARCDLVSLHAPGGAVIVDSGWLASARRGLVLVNTARPDLIDEGPLAAALRDGRLAGFAADTLAGDTAGLTSPLLADDLADRVVITPHFGAQTVEAVDAMGSMAVSNVLAVLAGATPPFPVPLEG